MTPDINVLVAASRTDHVHYRQAYSWLTGAIADCATGETLAILPMVAAGFLRLVTHPKIFKNPTPSPAAVDFIDALLSIPGVEMPELGREWPVLRQLCRDGKLTADKIPDAWIAAAVKASGGHLVTFDRDFSRLLKRGELTILAAKN